MTFDRFIDVYHQLSLLRSVNICLPAVKEVSYHDAVMRLGIRGELPLLSTNSQWADIIDFQFYQLKLYLKNFWPEMLSRQSWGFDNIIDYFEFHQELLTFMGVELFAFLEALREKFKASDYYIEVLLKTKASENILRSYSFDEMLHRRFVWLVSVKNFRFRENLDDYAANHSFFMDWMPQWKEIYPDVWSVIADRLKKMNDDGRIALDYDEYRKIYELYVQE